MNSTDNDKGIAKLPETSSESAIEPNKNSSLEKLEQASRQLEEAAVKTLGHSADHRYVASLDAAIARINENINELHTAQAELIAPRSIPVRHGCCEGNKCRSANCCTVEFVFSKVRMIAGQIGADKTLDGETTIGGAGERSGMEMQFFASFDGFGIIVPNQIWRFIKLEKRLDRPGVWYEIDRVINKIDVDCDEKKEVKYTLQAVEREIGTSEVILGKDEFGSVSGAVAVTCCDSGPVPLLVPLVLEGGGRGRGEVEVMFEIRKAC